MQVTKFEWIFIGALLIAVFGIMLHGCSGDATAPTSEMYQKCIETTSDSTECDKEYTVYF